MVGFLTVLLEDLEWLFLWSVYPAKPLTTEYVGSRSLCSDTVQMMEVIQHEIKGKFNLCSSLLLMVFGQCTFNIQTPYR